MILAIPGGDAAELVKQHGRDQVPVNPQAKGAVQRSEPLVLDWEARPSIVSVIKELASQEWYKDQIVHRRSTEKKPGQTGELYPVTTLNLTFLP